MTCCLILLASALLGDTGAVVPSCLRCEYRVDPLGIDVRQPRLSWVVESDQRVQRQTACQILVATSPDRLTEDAADLWNTGKVLSDDSVHVTYAGKPLSSRMQAYWKVQVWDRNGRPSAWSEPASWTMGLLEASDWQGEWMAVPLDPAQWISPHNGFHSALASSPDVAKWVVLDLGRSQTIDAVQLHPARPYDWPDTPGFLFPVRFRIDVADAADFREFRTVLDRTESDVPNPGTESPRYTVGPVMARFVRLFVTRLARRDAEQHGFALAQMRVFWGDKNVALNAVVTAADAIDSGGWSRRNLVNGVLASRRESGGERQPAPLLRKTFRLAERPRRAIVYASALGLYELHINGHRVGDQVLAPEWTDYNQRVQYQAHDVTDLLMPGDNVLAAVLGDGWYAGRIGLSGIVPGGPPWGIYGRKPRLLAQLEVELPDGQPQRVLSDATWRVNSDGPIRANDLLDGESYDARREVPGWDAPGFDDSAWQLVQAAPLTAAPRLVAQPNEPIRVVRELKPVAVSEPQPGVFVFDVGQNMVGRCRLRTRAAPGTTVTLRHGEALNPDGTVYTANLRGAAQTDRYTFRTGEPEEFEPRFTYHGFRYVEMSGLPTKPAEDALVGRVFHSAAPETGRFECSSPMLTRLMQNIVWTQRANLMSVPTDCPQRDERLGWMGDIQAFAQTACFNMDMAGFFTKWLCDVRDAQAADGRFPDFAPHPFGSNERFAGAPAWADAGVFVPWVAYVNYGDTRLIEQNYDAMRRWVELVRTNNPELIWRNGRGNDYGDWLNGDTLKLDGWPQSGGAVPKDVLATAYFAQSAALLAKMAGVLGRGDHAAEYGQLADQIRSAFCRAFVKPDGSIEGDTQAGYALALHFDLLPESLRPAATARLLNAIDRYNGRLSTGIQTSHRLMLELTRAGHNDIAYQQVNNRTVPSLGYMIDRGATTIWERWDGYVPDRGFQDPGMNSFNHWAFGAVGEWMYRTISGIEPDPDHPGYRQFSIRPRPGGGLSWARAEYSSIRGKIVSDWRLDNGVLGVHVVIPANTKATVHVPAASARDVSENGKPASQSPGVRFLHMADGAAVFAVESGSYQFAAAQPEIAATAELTDNARRLLAGCRVTATDGTTLYTPDGKGNYKALWTRDFAYIVENAGDLLPPDDIAACIRYLIRGQREDGWIPDRVGPDGTPIYTAGGPDFWKMAGPNIDNAQFLVIAVDEYLKRMPSEKRLGQFREWAAALDKGMDTIPRNDHGLVYSDPKRPHSPYGFTDCIGKTGALFMESLLYWTASRRLAAWHEQAGDRDRAAEYRRRADLIEAATNVLWDDQAGAFLAATDDCRQLDMWANAYAVWLGFPPPKKHDRIVKFLIENYDRCVWRGQVRHLLKGEHWHRLLTPVEKDRYQNGAYWATASGWMMWAIAQQDPAKARQMFRDLMADFSEGDMCECINEGYRQLPSYVVSATNPLAAARRLWKD
jgi:alpha-L-rhamnosidase